MHRSSPRLLRVHHDRWRPAPTARMPGKTIPPQAASARSRHASCRPASGPLRLPEASMPKSSASAMARRQRFLRHSPPLSRPHSRVSANTLSTIERPRYHVAHRGNYVKTGVDRRKRRSAKSPASPMAHGAPSPPPPGDTLRRCRRGTVTRPSSHSGDYRLFYAAVRDAILGKGPAPSPGRRVARGSPA